jgi:hypothetical protein
MNGLTVTAQQAIQAAKNQNWPEAIALNQQILADNPQDIPALIRLGVAQAQIQELKEAKKAFEKVVELDKSNLLARKHLLKLKNNQTISLSTLPANEEFIEEPGKTKTAELHRLASKEQLDKFRVGQVCQLKPKSRFISVEIDKTYLGSLPEDLSARLSKLMQTGNEYACYIRSLSPTSCTVFIKETIRSKVNAFTNSFIVQKSQIATLNDMFLADDTMPLQIEDIPLQIVETDTDEEKTPEDFSLEEPMDDVHQEEPDSDRD